MILNKMETKNKILIFSTAYYPFVGGAEVAVKEITDRLDKDFEFDLITAKLTPNLPTVEKIGNVNIHRIGRGNPRIDKLLLPLRGAFYAWKLEKKNRYFSLWGIMVTFGSGAAYILSIMRFLTGQKKIPIVLTLQEGDSEAHLKYKWGGLIALSWKAALRLTDKLTGISNFLIERARKNGFKKETFLVPNGVDLTVFSRRIDIATEQAMKKKLGKNDGDIFLVTSGRLTHKNAVDDIISALAFLPENVKFVVIGKGDLGPELQKQARDMGVEKRVKFLGFVAYADIPNIFSACDIFIRPSRSEGFGNSFIEAMAFGLPVIATPVGGIVDFIDDKETGIFCSPDHPQGIAKAVGLLLSDSVLARRIIEKARDRVVKSYSWDHVSQLMKAVFDKLNK